MTTGKVFLGILAGFAAGAALGILFAPDKGKVTRGKIADKSKDLADSLNKTVSDKFNTLAGALTGKPKTVKTAEHADVM